MTTRIPLGPFELHEPLGAGGVGEVWRAIHVEQGVPVAVKVLTGERARNRRFRRLFRAEVRAVASLDHPGVVRVLDQGEVDRAAADASLGRLVAGSPFLAMELASGGSLDQRAPPATWGELRGVLLAILDALAHAHARGIVHRDLKPGNALVCTDEDARPGLKLSDFGLAHVLDDEAEGLALAGTPRYMAPEQFRGDWRGYGPWTDLYALGCMAWELACGAPPFAGDDTDSLAFQHLSEPLPPFAPSIPVPAAFRDWLAALLAKAPSSRAQRAADAAHALVALGDAAPSAIAAPLPLETQPTLIALWAPDERTVITDPDADAVELQPMPPPVVERAFPVPPFPPTWRSGAPSAPSMRLVGAGLGLYGLREIPLVDREADRDALWDLLRAVVQDGSPRAIVLRGPAGTGKSRLARWICERAEELGAAGAWRAVHQPVAGARDGLGGMVVRQLRCGGLSADQLRQRLAPLGDDVISLVGPLVAPEEPIWPVTFGSAAERWALVKRLLRDADRPVVVWLDDAQWGADALGFARALLADRAEPVPALIVATVNDDGPERAEQEALDALLASPRATCRTVDALAEDDARALARELLVLDADVAQAVERRTAGNPMFAVQLVGDWVRRGVLVPGPDGFVLRKGEEARLPDDIHALWLQRLAPVEEGDAADALEVAAALGLAVDADEWALTCEQAGVRAPEALVDRLIESALAVPAESGWVFVHGLLRESLLRRSRDAGREARWNGACAEVLAARELRFPEVAGRLGRHWMAAGRPERALDPLYRAAQRIQRAVGELVEAHRLLDLWEQAALDARLPPADRRWVEAFALRAMTHASQTRGPEALAWGRRAEAVARRHGWTDLLPQAVRIQATANLVIGNLDACEQLGLQALDLARAAGQLPLVITQLNTLGDIHRLRGDFDRAEAYYREATSYAGISSSGEAEAVMGLALVRRHQGRLDDAQALFEQGLALAERVGTRNTIAMALNGLGEVARSAGRADDAEARYRQALEVYLQMGSERTAVPRMNLAMLLLGQRRFAEARDLLLPERRALRARGRRALAACCGALLATCAAGEDAEAFDRELRGFVDYRRETGFLDSDVAEALEIGAARWEAALDSHRARAAWTEVRDLWDGLGVTERRDAAAARIDALAVR